MTPLRQRMLGDMQFRGFSLRTQEAYVRAVHQLAAHFHRPPDQLGEEELREYFLYLTNVKHFARASFTIALCGIKFFYERTLGREWNLFELVRPVREKKRPVILSREEVQRILTAVRLPVYRACLTTSYVCGRRLLEGAHLQVADVDSARGLLHISTSSRSFCRVVAHHDHATAYRANSLTLAALGGQSACSAEGQPPPHRRCCRAENPAVPRGQRHRHQTSTQPWRESSSDTEANDDANQDGASNRERSEAPHQPQRRQSGAERRGVGHGRSEGEHERHAAGEIVRDPGATHRVCDCHGEAGHAVEQWGRERRNQ
jgi:integrase-like protein